MDASKVACGRSTLLEMNAEIEQLKKDVEPLRKSKAKAEAVKAKAEAEAKAKTKTDAKAKD